MKDSMGSTVLIQIFVVFMVVFIILMASILNYTKTFRIKNQVINIINRHGGYTSDAREEIKDYISKSSIYGQCVLLEGTNDFGSSTTDRCEIKEYKVKDAVGGSYYKVRVYVTFMFPLIKETLHIPITGETKRLYNSPNNNPKAPTYEMVNKNYSPTEVSFSIAGESCIPESPPPPSGGGGCCSPAICGGTVGGLRNSRGCGCYDSSGKLIAGEKTRFNPNKPGRIPDVVGAACCFYHKDCAGKATLKTATVTGGGKSGPLAIIMLTFDDPNQVGIKECTVTNGSCPTTTRCEVKGGTELISSVRVACIDPLGTSSSLDVAVNVIDCGETTHKEVNGRCVETCTVGKYNCAQCEMGECTLCEDNYEPGGGTGHCVKACEVGKNNCKSCYAGKCTECDDDYKVNESGKCEYSGKCYCCGNSQGCNYKWSSTGETPNSTCALTTFSKAQCSGTSSNPANCTIRNCAKCATKSTCETCNAGFKLNSNKSSCVNICSISKCDLCESESTCKTCALGYKLKKAKTMCEQNINCPANCSLCDEVGDACYTCKSGYYINDDDECSACDTGCTVCSGSSSNCTSCATNYTLSGSKCCSKISNCATYTASCGCDKCAAGYHKNLQGGCDKDSTGGTTPACPENCNCNMYGACTSCTNDGTPPKCLEVTCEPPKRKCTYGSGCCGTFDLGESDF